MGLPAPRITEADVHAVRAVLEGKANADEQRRAMEWIGVHVCRIFDTPYVADGADRDTFVAIGRHQVGVMISAMRSEETLLRARAFDQQEARGKS